MATKEQVKDFINKIGALAVEICSERGYGNAQAWTCVCQAGLETGWGVASKRMMISNAIFGIKATDSWIENGGACYSSKTREVINGVTKRPEQYFRAYPNLKASLEDYFNLLETTRYRACLNTTTVQDCITVIKNGGYATDPDYINSICAIYRSYKTYIETWQVTTKKLEPEKPVQDKPQQSTPVPQPQIPETNEHSRQKVVSIISSWIGFNESNGTHKPIIDLYNSYAAQHGMTKFGYNVAWCAICASAVAIAAGYTDIIPITASCNDMIAKFKKLGCWIEDESVIPQIGWYCFYDWQDGKDYKSDNVGVADHVGIITSVGSDTFVVAEGNCHGAVKYRTMHINGQYLRGFGAPNYENKVVEAPTPEVVVPKPEPKPNEMLKYATAWLGFKESNGSNRSIIDFYNIYAQQHGLNTVTYEDGWNTVFISATAIAAKYTNIIPITSSGIEMADAFKVEGKWGNQPQVGGLCFYGDGQPTNVGIINAVGTGTFNMIAGDTNNEVLSIAVAMNNPLICGFVNI